MADSIRAPIVLTMATAEDVPELVTVHTAAFKSDMFSNLMLLNKPADAHQTLMKKSIDYWLADAQSHIVKAVNDGGRIVGFACWVITERSEATQETSTSSNVGQAHTSSAPAKLQGQGQSPAQDPSRTLSQLMREDMVRFEEMHLTGKRYMILQALATLPECQGHGIGTRLVQWGVDRADSDSLLCWAHASPASHSLYERAGFREVGRCGFDLSEWAPGRKGGGRGWGVYTFRYMLRPAKQ